ncbi:hypothetical protein BJV78DRAFT_1182811, partial [Lactifluus subvellereus]
MLTVFPKCLLRGCVAMRPPASVGDIGTGTLPARCCPHLQLGGMGHGYVTQQACVLGASELDRGRCRDGGSHKKLKKRSSSLHHPFCASHGTHVLTALALGSQQNAKRQKGASFQSLFALSFSSLHLQRLAPSVFSAAIVTTIISATNTFHTVANCVRSILCDIYVA